jgi:hypothetical protein
MVGIPRETLPLTVTNLSVKDIITLDVKSSEVIFKDSFAEAIYNIDENTLKRLPLPYDDDYRNHLTFNIRE